MNTILDEYKNFSPIAKWKILLLKYGVKFEPLDLFNKVSNIDAYKVKWRVVQPKANGYQVYDISQDKTVIPSEIIISDGNTKSVVKLRYNEKSPITIILNENKICMKIDDKKVDINIELVKKADILKEKIPYEVVKKDVCIGDYIDIVGVDRVSILFFEGCFNWLAGKPCKFCDLHPKKNDDNTVKPTLNNLVKYNFNVKKWWNDSKEEYLKGLEYSLNKIIKENKLNHIHIFFMAGNMPTNKDVWDIAEETIKYLSKTIELQKFDNYLNIAPHDTLDRIKRIKQMGIKQIQYNLEVVSEENFNNTCPGKMKYNDFMNKLQEATKVYGKGNVRSNFVLGLDSMKETIEFANKIAKNGIVFDYSVFQPKKCTPYSNKVAPDFEEVVKFSEELVKIYKKYNFKPIFCSLSSRSSIVNEIMMQYSN